MTSRKTIEFEFERTIHASPSQVFDAWLSPGVAGTPWSVADKLMLDPTVDGLFFLAVKGATMIPHFGRFLVVERPRRIEHTWMSPNTSGVESKVTVTFDKSGKGTRMVLRHTHLPNTSAAKGHKDGWDYFLDLFPKQFDDATTAGEES
jgi:uncharacterized protein YndB with AHSA1/START domain